MPEYLVFSGPYLRINVLTEKTPYSNTFHAVFSRQEKQEAK